MFNKTMSLVKIVFFLSVQYCLCLPEYIENISYKWPTVGISFLVRNKEYSLPYFLTCLHRLDYPKDRLYIWIYTDLNEDKSVDILEDWANHHKSEYNGFYLMTNNSSHNDVYEPEPSYWSLEHFKHIIRLRQMALDFGRKMWADYIFMIDADVFLTNPSTLKYLVTKKHTIMSPMLLSDGLYSNFWCGMTEKYYYKRTDDYKPILNRDEIGCFAVPMVHTAVLISLRTQDSDFLTYDPTKIQHYDGPIDDIIAFAVNAKKFGIPLNICNEHLYGFVSVPLEDNVDLINDFEQVLNIKLEAISKGVPLPLDPNLEQYVHYPQPWKFGCDEIYMINLERRSERRHLMEISFRELGMNVKWFKAIDGRDLDLQNLQEISITLMPNYEDPYHKRPMKSGEVGCFLSHYYIWKEITEKHHEVALVLEDDIHFVPYFRHRLLQLLREIKELDWDMVYIGRKILQDSEEKYVTEHTTSPLYSYWTLGYLITERGAKKLIDVDPLSKMLPVDEFLPIMFDQHPNDTWKSHFPRRNLLALSAAPLLVQPTHYTGQEGYVSDTEDSIIVDANDCNARIKNEL